MKTTTERVFQIFKELNQIPRPSHHEERVADYLCRFAERLNLPYKRDKENCVVISKPATQGVIYLLKYHFPSEFPSTFDLPPKQEIT